MRGRPGGQGVARGEMNARMELRMEWGEHGKVRGCLCPQTLADKASTFTEGYGGQGALTEFQKFLKNGRRGRRLGALAV